MSIPTNTPDSFGAAATSATGTMTVIDALNNAPAPNEKNHLPSVQRILQGNGADIILFTFTPGQSLNDHKSAHPITVQCLRGTLDFTCDGNTVALTPGTVVHLTDHVIHRVDCPSTATDTENVLLLTMLTGANAAQ